MQSTKVNGLPKVKLLLIIASLLIASLAFAAPPQLLTLPFSSTDVTVIQGWVSNAKWNGKTCVFLNGGEIPYTPPPSKKKGDYCIHEGLDYALGSGKEFDVLSALNGRAICVQSSSQLKSEKQKMGSSFFTVAGTRSYTSAWGTYVVMKHDVNGIIYYSYYIHLKKDSCLSISGQKIDRGVVIGKASDSGSAKGGVIHLHFEFRDVNEKSIDPYGLKSRYSSYPTPTSDKKLTTPSYWKDNPPRGPNQTKTILVSSPVLTPSDKGGMCGNAWLQISGYNGAKAYLTLNADKTKNSTNSGVWKPSLPTKGQWKVEAYLPNHKVIKWQCPTKTISYDTSKAKYLIVYKDGKTKEVIINQSPLANQWITLGTFSFASGTSGYVKLSDLTGEAYISRTVSFSAMRFTYIGP